VSGNTKRGAAKRLAASLLALWLAPSMLWADPSASRIRKAVDAIVSQPGLDTAFWGVEVRSLPRGRVLYSLNADKAFRPASTLKLVITAAALESLGPDERPRTTLQTAARLDGFGRLLGDVFLVGGGDPNGSARFSESGPAAAFEAMAAALVAGGVRRIEGRVVGHEGAFTGDRRGAAWIWEDLAWGYGTEVSALSYADNLVEAELLPGERVGDPARLALTPDSGCVTVTSSVVTAEARAAGQGTDGIGVSDASELTLLREPGSNEVRLTGRLPLGGRWKQRLAVADPAACAAAVFAALLERRAVQVGSGVATSSAPLPAGARVLASYDGVPLRDALRPVNKDSQNLHAEMLLRYLGLRVKGEGSVERGREAVSESLRRLGVAETGWAVADGSGLSRNGLVTPTGIVALLAAMDRHAHGAVFRDSLAIAGRDGTLERRMRGTSAEGRVLGKTGSFQLVNALAGYVTTTRGERLAFAVYVNNHAQKGREAVAAIDRIAVALAEAR
jgi:D-alanyl-D-alanine carboxypeptidase/D-alanyl-D-alanine-endopeptidase (penicillin-binding protein 4)